MHVYFSGIGGAAIGPLALIAHNAGYTVSGSDKQDSSYIEYLQRQGVTDVHIGQSREQIAEVHAREPIDWFVYTSALPMEQPDAPELRFCSDQGIQATKRDVFLSALLREKNLEMIAVAGTHGKTTTTAMAIWLCKQLGMPVSYSVGAKLSFGDMGEYNPDAKYFIYEADEFDRNFLAFQPALSIVTGIDWDHPDIYPTRENYNQAFRDFLNQSRQAVIWDEDKQLLGDELQAELTVLTKADPVTQSSKLAGQVNRENALQVAAAVSLICDKTIGELLAMLDGFPGVSRRFEQLAPNLYTDYAHTPPKIRGALQLAHEVAGDNVVVVYEGLHNTRQHFIKDDLKHLFDNVKQLYIVPSYLAREDPNLPLLQPADLKALLSDTAQVHTDPATLGDKLAAIIRKHQAAGDLVLCITAGGGHSLDEWLRKEFVR
jgi:UDP-N-acetylmuramate--alanine ligase